MALTPAMRREVLDLTYRLDRLLRMPLPSVMVDGERVELNTMLGFVLDALNEAWSTIDFVDHPPRAFAHRPKSLPAASLGHLIHARQQARDNAGKSLPRRLRP